jgi:L-amino acid N-acyltransferase YncA
LDLLGIRSRAAVLDRAVREVDDPPRGVVVCERAGAVIGYAAYRLFAVEGHLANVAVAADARRGGVGRALMQAAASRMRAAGVTAWCLNVKADNTPAIRLYEGLGMSVAYASTVVRIAWVDVLRLPADAPGVVASVTEAADDDELERVFGLATGRLVAQRARGGRVILQLREGGAAAGVACFAPEFPGAYPFRVARPELAGVLLGGMQPHARPSDSWVQLTADDDRALVTTLVAAGGHVHLELLHYRGPL